VQSPSSQHRGLGGGALPGSQHYQRAQSQEDRRHQEEYARHQLAIPIFSSVVVGGNAHSLQRCAQQSGGSSGGGGGGGGQQYTDSARQPRVLDPADPWANHPPRSLVIGGGLKEDISERMRRRVLHTPYILYTLIHGCTTLMYSCAHTHALMYSYTHTDTLFNTDTLSHQY
jgi:hypothetical protein